jgi:uncharacterized membrane protein
MLLSQFILVTLSALLHAVWNFFAKKAPQDLEIITLGLAMVSVLSLPIFFLEAVHVTSFGIALAVLTGAIQAVYVLLLYRAYHSSNLTLVYPLSRGLGVMCTFFIESILIPHLWSEGQMLGILVVTLGTSCLAIPHLWESDKKGVLCSVAIGVLLGFAFLLGRYSTSYISAFPYLWGMYASSVVFLLPFLRKNFRVRMTRAYTHYKYIAAIIGIGSFLSYLLIVYLFKTLPAAPVVAVRELSVVFGAILGFVFLREKATRLKIVTILAIVVGAVLLKLG